MIEVRLPDGSVARFPNGTSQETMEGALAQFRSSPAPVSGETDNAPVGQEKGWGEVAGEAVKNFIPSAVNAASDFAEAIAHPIDTATGLYNVGRGYLEKLNRVVQENSGGWEEGEIKPGEHEKYADAVNKFYRDRYGSVEALKNTLSNDSAGALLDLGSVLSLGGAGLKAVAPGKVANAMTKAGAVLDPITLPSKAVAKAGNVATEASKTFGKTAWEALRPRTGEEIIRKMVKPSTGDDPFLNAKITKLILENELPLTLEGVQKLKDIKKEKGAQIGAILEDVANQQREGKLPMTDMSELLEDARLKATEDYLDSMWGTEKIEEANKAAAIAEHNMAGPKDILEVEKFRKINADDLDTGWDKTSGLTPKKRLQKEVVRGARDEIRRLAPESAPLYDELHGLHQVQTPFEAAVNRLMNNDNAGGLAGNVGLSAELGSRTLGSVGAVGGYLHGLINRDPAYLSQLAFKRYKKSKSPQKPKSRIVTVPQKYLLNPTKQAFGKVSPIIPNGQTRRALIHQAARTGLLDLFDEEWD